MDSKQWNKKSVFAVISRQGLVNFLFVVIVFLLTRQVPLSFLSPLMNLSVILILILSLYKIRPNKKLVMIVSLLLLLPLTYNLLYSMVATDNKVLIGLKFYIVLLSLGLAYFVRVERNALKWFVKICLLQVVVMIGIYIFILTFFDEKTYLSLRLFFVESGWGDIYTFDGLFYRIQIKGSALLVIALILSLEIDLFKKKYFVAAFLLLGIVLAGNFAFLMGLSVYVFYKMFSLKSSRSVDRYLFKIACCVTFLAVMAPYIYQYTTSIIELKEDFSLLARRDQIKVLWYNLGETPFSLLLGQGLGNTLNVVTPVRDYTDSVYFEVQGLYIINQLGILFFLCFIVYNVIVMILHWGKNIDEVYLVYLVYIIYSTTNPYIFDTNHFVVIIVLNSWIYIKREIKKDEARNSCGCSTV